MLYTVGHSDRSMEQLVRVLEHAGIRVLVDVRRYPGSRRHPQFNKGSLQSALADRDIEYRWRGEALGGRRAAADSRHAGLGSGMMQAYAQHMESDAFLQAAQEVAALATSHRVALMCAERLPEHCHRSLIADYFTLEGLPVRHLIEIGVDALHRPHPSARRMGRRVVYGTRAQMAFDLDG
jgi:uncharacterized protein (DUF488 family)